MKCGNAHCCNNGSKPFARSMVLTRGMSLMCLLLMSALVVRADHSFKVEAAAAKLEPSATTSTRPARASEDDMIGLREDIFELQPDKQRGSSTGEMKKKSMEGLRQSRKMKEAKYEEHINVAADHEDSLGAGRIKKSKDTPDEEYAGVSRIEPSTKQSQSRRNKVEGLKGKLVKEIHKQEVHLVQEFKKLSPKINHNHLVHEVNEEDDVELQPLEEVVKERGTINSINVQESEGKPKKSNSTSRKESTNHDGEQSKLKLKSAKLEVNKELPQKGSGGGKDGDEVSDGDQQKNRSAKGRQGESSRGVRGAAADDSQMVDDRLLTSSAKSSLNVAAAADDDNVGANPSSSSYDRNDRANTDDHQVEEEEEVAEEREEDKELVAEYNLGEPIRDWDMQRQEWAAEHPEVKREQLFILTGTQPWPCANAEGDHLLLRCFKNKVDYSRIHGVGMFYNTALLDAHMPTFWAKLPVVRATMLAHPEVEWIWWLDADAIITDMEFEIPLQHYAAYNLVVHGWESLVFEKRSWLGLNAGSFLLRNCQWSMDLLERWASMGPKAPMGDAYRHILSDFLPDRPRNPTDDQAALVYLLIKERERWADKLRVELDFFLSGYWLELMDGFEATEKRYRAMEERHAELVELLQLQGDVGKEKMVRVVGRAREKHLSGTSVQERRPFITHFTGCQPCSGHHNTIYSKEQCNVGLVRALNYADDQVLRTLGYQHHALHLPDVLPHSFSRSST